MMRIIREKRINSLLYPLSGGFHHSSLWPLLLVKALEDMEGLMRPIFKHTAFRLFLVLDKS